MAPCRSAGPVPGMDGVPVLRAPIRTVQATELDDPVDAWLRIIWSALL